MSGYQYKPQGQLTQVEMRARARDYRLLAATATTSRLRHELLQMAERIELRAAKEETEDETSCRDNHRRG